MASRHPETEAAKRVVETFRRSRKEVGLSGEAVALGLGFSKRLYNYMEAYYRRPIALFEAVIDVISDEALRTIVDDVIDFCVKRHNKRVKRKQMAKDFRATFSHLDSTRPPVRKKKRDWVKKRRWKMPKMRKYPLRKKEKFFKYDEKPWFTMPRYRKRIEDFGIEKAERLLDL
jgi:hypothetical protein